MDELEKVIGQIAGLHDELSTLAKKSHNDALNKFKLKFVNAALSRCNDLLGDSYKPFREFHTFEAEEVVSNSDAAFMLSQYSEALEKLRRDNVKQLHGVWFYDLPKDENLRAAPPARIKE